MERYTEAAILQCNPQSAADELLEQSVHLEQQTETQTLLSAPNRLEMIMQERRGKLQQLVVRDVRPVQHNLPPR